MGNDQTNSIENMRRNLIINQNPTSLNRQTR